MRTIGTTWHIGAAVLDAERGVLHRADGAETTLRPKTLELLLLLTRQAGRLVSRAEILDTIWAGVNVTDDSITQCVGEIRRALGEEAARLKTVPRRGYLLEGPVTAADGSAAIAEPPAADPPARRPVPRLAVAGVSLAAAAWLLAWLLSPSQPPAPAATAAPALTAAATPRPDPDAPEPPSAAEQSMALWREGRAVLRSSGRIVETRLQARALFERAIELDPNNFRALSEAAFTYTNAVLGNVSLNPEADLTRAAALTERAVAIESRHAVTHTARAAVLRLQGRHEEALEHYRMAVLYDPSAHASRANIGWMLLLTGHAEEAAAPVLASLAANDSPQFQGAWLTYLGLTDLHAGSGDHGVARLRASLEYDAFMPRHERLLYLVAALATDGQAEEAAALAAEAAARHPQYGAGWFAGRAQSDNPVYRAQFTRIVAAVRAAGLPE